LVFMMGGASMGWFEIMKYEFYTNMDGVAYAFTTRASAQEEVDRLNRNRNSSEPMWRMTATTESTERKVPVKTVNESTGEIETSFKTRGNPKGSSIFGRGMSGPFYIRRSYTNEPNYRPSQKPNFIERKSVDDAIDDLEEVAEKHKLKDKEWDSVDDASDYLFEHKVKEGNE